MQNTVTLLVSVFVFGPVGVTPATIVTLLRDIFFCRPRPKIHGSYSNDHFIARCYTAVLWLEYAKIYIGPK
jgi:hypothetical protein